MKLLGNAVIATLLFALILNIQGCIQAGIVAVTAAHGAYLTSNLTRSIGDGNVEIKPFENSFFAAPEELNKIASAKILAIAPFEGASSEGSFGGELAAELTTIVEIKIISPYKFRETSLALPPRKSSDEDIADFARKVGEKTGSDLVIYGSVVSESIKISTFDILFGGQPKNANRLAICLASAKTGQVFWKDEMPYVVSIGTSPIPENELAKALVSEMMKRVREKIPLRYKSSVKPIM